MCGQQRHGTRLAKQYLVVDPAGHESEATSHQHAPNKGQAHDAPVFFYPTPARMHDRSCQCNGHQNRQQMDGAEIAEHPDFMNEQTAQRGDDHERHP